MILMISILALTLELTAPEFRQCYILAETGLRDERLLDWTNIDLYLRKSGIQEIDIVKAQIRLETGDLQSRFCKECNNLFGMEYPRKRKTTAIGRDKMMSVYSRWQDSVLDYKLFQDYFYKGGDYYSFLKSHGYATDKRYIEKLKTINQ